MAKSKRARYAAEGKGRYKKDHSYVDISSDEHEDGMYTDASSVEESEHERLQSKPDDGKNKEEDFISLDTEIDTRSRQERRNDERADLKRKRGFEEEDDYESKVCYPWMELMGSNRLRPPITAIRLLQREVSCFVQYVEPTPIEVKLRNYLVHRVRHAIQRHWPEAEVLVFGSFSTTLYLPNSDIDLVVVSPPSVQIRLRKVASILEAADICREPQVIEKASVPVIKFADSMTNLKVDIILESTTGVDSARVINKLVVKYPSLRPLSLIVKHLLALRGLNEVFTGGLGGYAIVCLVVSFLQMHPKVASGAIDPMENLGALLLDFLQLYGINFNIDNVGIDVRGDGSYYESRVVCRGGRAAFSIRDPLDPSNDIGMKSFNSISAVRCFKYAYLAMSSKAFEMEEELRENNYRHTEAKRQKGAKEASLLGTFIHISDDFMNQRQLMNDVFNEKRWEGQSAAESFSFI